MSTIEEETPSAKLNRLMENLAWLAGNGPGFKEYSLLLHYWWQAELGIHTLARENKLSVDKDRLQAIWAAMEASPLAAQVSIRAKYVSPYGTLQQMLAAIEEFPDGVSWSKDRIRALAAECRKYFKFRPAIEAQLAKVFS